MLTRDYPAGVPLGLIRKRMLYLSGPTPPQFHSAISARAAELGLKRPDGPARQAA